MVDPKQTVYLLDVSCHLRGDEKAKVIHRGVEAKTTADSKGDKAGQDDLPGQVHDYFVMREGPTEGEE